MFEQVAVISDKLEAVERGDHRTSVRGAARDRRHRLALRRELYEAHRLIDGIHRRFPETAPPARSNRGRRAMSGG
jgi:hypothetical protein